MDAELMDYVTAQEWIMDHDEDSEKSISLVINVPTVANTKKNDSFPVRRKAIEWGVPVMTCMDTARVFLKAIKQHQKGIELTYNSLD